MKVSRTERKSLISAATANGYETMEQVIELLNANPRRTAGSNKVLRTISGPIMIDACDGSHILSEATEVFAWIDSDFKNWNLNQAAKSTDLTPVIVHEMVKDANFRRIFDFADVALEDLCLTQHQIKAFCQHHRNWLRADGYGTFFLFRKDEQKAAKPDNLFVAYVFLDDDGLNVCVHKFLNDIVRNCERRHRVVLPQLTSMPL